MTPRTERQLYATASLVLASVLLCGLLLAYGAAAAGILGLMSSWHVASFAFSGAAVSFLGIVGYFLVGNAQIRARLGRLNDTNDASCASRNN